MCVVDRHYCFQKGHSASERLAKQTKGLLTSMRLWMYLCEFVCVYCKCFTSSSVTAPNTYYCSYIPRFNSFLRLQLFRSSNWCCFFFSPAPTNVTNSNILDFIRYWIVYKLRLFYSYHLWSLLCPWLFVCVWYFFNRFCWCCCNFTVVICLWCLFLFVFVVILGAMREMSVRRMYVGTFSIRLRLYYLLVRCEQYYTQSQKGEVKKAHTDTHTGRMTVFDSIVIDFSNCDLFVKYSTFKY